MYWLHFQGAWIYTDVYWSDGTNLVTVKVEAVSSSKMLEWMRLATCVKPNWQQSFWTTTVVKTWKLRGLITAFHILKPNVHWKYTYWFSTYLTKTNKLMIFKKGIGLSLSLENNTLPLSTRCGQNVKLFVLRQGYVELFEHYLLLFKWNRVW
jgi:hypothetical protein